MDKRVKDKLKLMRAVHGVGKAWITEDDVYTRCPENFTGVYYAWHENGKLKYEYNTKDGKCHGLCRIWYDNGQLCYEENSKNGKLHGLKRRWFDDGRLCYKSNYKNGVLISAPKKFM